jgi:hypothetical protein
VDIKLIARISAGAGGWSMEEYMEVNREDYVRKESAKESLKPSQPLAFPRSNVHQPPKLFDSIH